MCSVSENVGGKGKQQYNIVLCVICGLTGGKHVGCSLNMLDRCFGHD